LIYKDLVDFHSQIILNLDVHSHVIPRLQEKAVDKLEAFCESVAITVAITKTNIDFN
jgi:hypothetical protein